MTDRAAWFENGLRFIHSSGIRARSCLCYPRAVRRCSRPPYLNLTVRAARLGVWRSAGTHLLSCYESRAVVVDLNDVPAPRLARKNVTSGLGRGAGGTGNRRGGEWENEKSYPPPVKFPFKSASIEWNILEV